MELWPLTLCLLVAACHQQAASLHIADTTIIHPDTPSAAPVAEAAQPWKPFKTHLVDTLKAEGSFILFLTPTEQRYNEMVNDSTGSGDADSDFGDGIRNTLDSLKANSHYKDIQGLVSQQRYILIKDCKGGPIVLDRDTISYGVVLSAPGKAIDTTQLGEVHSGDYCGQIRQYFFGEEE